MSAEAVEKSRGELDMAIGIDAEHRQELADGLNRCLASTYVLYGKTQAFHWNVEGPLFYSVHQLTEGQYQELAVAIDVMAERVRALGYPAKSGLEAMLGGSEVADAADEVPEAKAMIAELADDHKKVAGEFRKVIPAAEKLDDYATADLLTQRIAEHEKAAWMLSALLQG